MTEPGGANVLMHGSANVLTRVSAIVWMMSVQSR
jgi:hypothetical protein